MNKPNTKAKKKQQTEQEYGVVEKFDVSRVRDTTAGVFFTLWLNGVTINNCKAVEHKDGDFISLPAYKGSDDKWYSTVYFKFSPDDQTMILALVEEMLNADNT